MIVSPSVSAIEETYTFSFRDYDEGWETDAGDMVDDDEHDYASTTNEYDVQYLKTGMSFGDEGDISKVELNVKAYWTGADADIVLQPVFGGVAEGDLHPFSPLEGVSNASFSDWFDITKDTNAHSFWTWEDVEDLCCRVMVDDHSSGFTLYCSIVQVRVTYEPN
jgi:hypothetical protein